MDKIYFIKKRTIILSIAVVLTFCLSSIAVPIINGMHTKEILNNAENKIVNESTYNTKIENPELIENSQYDNSFVEYWELYEEAIGLWHDMNDKHCSFQDWFDEVNGTINRFNREYPFYIAVSLILSAMGAVGVKYVSLVGWVVLGFIFYQVFDFSDQLVEGFIDYAILKNEQVDILVHVKGNVTDERKYGIPDLWADQRVVAKNIDAIDRCDGTNGKTYNLFTYYLGPADDFDQPGWYSLKRRYIPEYPYDMDDKAPHPPGNWTLEVKDTAEWIGSGIVPDENGVFIKAYGAITYEITLEPR